MMKVLLYLISCLSVVSLAGCSENGFWFRSGNPYDDTEPVESVYYIGEPYRIKGVLYTPAEDMSYSEKGFATWYTRPSQDRLTTNGEVFDDNKMTAAHKTLPLPSLVRITNLENGNTAIVRVNDRGPAVNNRLIDVSRQAAEALEFPETGTTLVQVDILPEQSRHLKSQLNEFVETGTLIEETTESISPDTAIYQPTDTVSEPVYTGSTVNVDMLPPVVDTEKTVSETVHKTSTSANVPVPQPIVEISQGNWYIQAGAFGLTENANRAVQALDKLGTVSTKRTNNMTVVLMGPFETRAKAKDILDKVRGAGYPDAWIKKVQ